LILSAHYSGAEALKSTYDIDCWASDLVSKRFVLLLLIFVTGVAFGSYAMVLAERSVRVTIDLSKSLVDANAALLGFLGIITVFVYNTYHEESRWTEDELVDLKEEHEYYLSSQSMMAEIPKEVMQANENEYEAYRLKNQELKDRHTILRRSARESFTQTIYSATFLVASMFLAFLAMAEVDSSVRVAATLFAVVAMGWGIIFLFLMIWSLRANLK
jgi:hypothetical protein